MKMFNLRQTISIVIICMLLTSVISYVAFSSGSTQNVYLDDLPATATYTVKTDDTNFWAVRDDGKQLWYSTNASYVFQSILEDSPNDADIFIKKGTYPNVTISIPHSTADRNIIIRGAGVRNTIIKGGAIATDSYIFGSEQASWQKSHVTLDDLTIEGTGVEQRGVYLPYTHLDIGKLEITGSFAAPAKMIEAGGAGASCRPCTIRELTIYPSGGVATEMARFWYEGLNIVNLGLIATNISPETYLRILGTHVTIQNLICYLGGGKSSTRIVYCDDAHLNIQNLFFARDAVPASLPFLVKAGGAAEASVVIGAVNTNGLSLASTPLFFEDAASRARTKLLGTFNMAQLAGNSTGTGAQQTIAHGLNVIPTRVILWNIEDGANPYQSAAADDTKIYITAVSGKDYGWKVEI